MTERPSSGDARTPAVSVIIPARDAAATLPRTLDGLARQQLDRPFEVIVVDNGSNDETAELAERHPLGARVIRRRRGEGPSPARNEGVAASRSEILAFTDSDCEPTPTWLAEGLRRLSGGVDIVAGAVGPPPDEKVGVFDRSLWVTHEHGLYETANLFVRKEWFDRLGGFQDLPGIRDAHRKPFGEDAWFVWRARRLGARSTFEPRAVVHHAVFRRMPGSYIRERWHLRYFPGLLKRIPELRESFAWNRWFLNSRTAAFDAALSGAIAAIITRSLLPLPAAAPYAARLFEDLSRWGKRRAFVMAVRDVVAFVALLVGSVRARSVLV